MINTIKRLLGFGPKVDYAELSRRGAIVLDVRSKREYAEGHIRGSINIPVETLSNNLSKLKDKSKPIITCCASGMRSAQAKSILKANGFSEVHNGGGWGTLKNNIS